jgi:predicted peptidase
MTAEKRRELHRFEGSSISLALADGSRLDDVQLVSARGMKLWIFSGGDDRFVPVSQVIDAWPSDAAAA